MGTIVRQRVYGIGGDRAARVAAAELVRLEALWSVFRPDSEISRLARCAGSDALAVQSDTLAVLAQAKQLHALTHGALDVTVAPLMKLWREAARSGCAPGESELAAALDLVDIDGLQLGPGRSTRLARVGQAVDLGAIGKGYAADRCVELYEEHGVKHAVMDFGGNVVVVGTKPDGSPWRVGIQAPHEPRGHWLGYLEVAHCSVVTSGSYERGFLMPDGHRSHVLDPRTGCPVRTGVLSATVVASSSAYADGLATACLVLGTAQAMQLLEAEEVDGILWDADGAHVTPGLASSFTARG